MEDISELSKDVLLLLAMQMDLPTLNNFCYTSKRINEKVCNNDNFWRNKLAQDFPDFMKHTCIKGKYKNKTDKEEYRFLTNILTRERFEQILKKPDIASEIIGAQESAQDLYDLLYNQEGDRDWGVIGINQDYDRVKYVFLRFLMNEMFDSYLEGEIGRRRSFLNELRQGNFTEEIEKYIGEIQDELSITLNSEELIASILTLEGRFQSYIGDNTWYDVRGEIKTYQDNLGDKELDEALYNRKEIEFLQILHDGIKTGKLSLFDPVDYDFLMKKLKQ